ncbi:hypothetical protein [Xanthobacter aminoxidans]|uniref:hypothetical protein n=1 Tax=Xanthobacter aminoxidans TaxID=186280 RepID=UPI002022E8DE|nr:hypothetical protein [Xanthobacter aminoxidans]MCL8382076.1 hypothetical protein [Xanthobacter aminoxidans]
MIVHILTAEHFSVPGIIVKVFASMAGAEAEACALANIMLKDAGEKPDADASTWQESVTFLQEVYGAAHCYVEIAPHEVYGAAETPDPVRDAAPDMLAALKPAADRLEYLGEDNETWTKDARAAIAKAEGR